MKKWIVIVILLVIVVLGASFMFKSHNETQQKENTTEAYEISENGVALTVPSTWVSAESKSNMTLLAVADPNSKDSSGFSNVNINVEKKEITNHCHEIQIMRLNIWEMLQFKATMQWKLHI